MMTENATEVIKISTWIPFPRDVYRKFINGDITSTSYLIYILIRHGVDKYGVTYTSAEELKCLVGKVINKNLKNNTITKSLKSLLDHNLIFYKNRIGKRGKFEVHVGDFLLPNKHTKILDSENSKGYVIIQENFVEYFASDVEHELCKSNPILEHTNLPRKSAINNPIDLDEITFDNMETDNNKNTEKHTSNNLVIDVSNL